MSRFRPELLPTQVINLGKSKTSIEGPKRIFSGKLTTPQADLAVAFPARTVNYVTISSLGLGDVWLGPHDVTKSSGFLLTGDITFHVGNLGSLYMVSDVENAGVYWMAA